MARGFIGNIQKEAQRQGVSLKNKLNIEKEVEVPKSATTPTDVPAPAPIEQPKNKKWLMPVLIGGGVLVVGILAYVLLKRKK